jgi:serine/threonine protein kinase
MKNQPVTSSLEALSVDAFDLVSWMIERDSKSRPTATQVCEHPYFWDSVKRSSFLCDFSDRIEAESLSASNNGTPSCDILALERNAQKVVGDAWNLKVDQDLLLHLSRYRSYDPSSVRDCLRMIRNKHHHFDEIPIELRQRMFHGSESLQGYFESKFPRLVQHCYSFCRQNLTNDDPLTIKYHILSIKSTPSTHSVRRDSAVDQDLIDNHAQAIPQSVSTLSSKKDLYDDLIIWEGSTAAKAYNCRGWLRSQEVWVLGSDIAEKKRDVNMTRCLEDPKFRTRLCNHWDTSQGVSCPMRKKYKCVFAHGPVELRVKEGKRDRWGKLCDKNGNNANPCHSGGEDT